MLNLFLDDEVSILPLSVRAKNCLLRNGIKTIQSLLEYGNSNVWINLPSMGDKTAQEIDACVKMISSGTNNYTLTNEKKKIDNSSTKIEKDIVDSFHFAFSVEELPIADSARKALIKAGKKDVAALKSMPHDRIKTIWRLNDHSARTIIKLLDQMTLPSPELKIWQYQNGVEQYERMIEIADELSDSFGISEKVFICMLLNTKENYPDESPDLLVNHLGKTGILRDCIKKAIVSMIDEQMVPVKLDDIKKGFPPCVVNSELPEIIVEQMIARKTITRDGETICKFYPSLIDTIDSLKDERAKRIIRLFLKGNSLRDVGEAFGLSAERVRQIVKPFVKVKDDYAWHFCEDRYVYLFSNYDVSNEILQKHFGEQEEVFGYLKVVCKKISRRKEPLAQAKNDPQIPQVIREQLVLAIEQL